MDGGIDRAGCARGGVRSRRNAIAKLRSRGRALERNDILINLTCPRTTTAPPTLHPRSGRAPPRGPGGAAVWGLSRLANRH